MIRSILLILFAFICCASYGQKSSFDWLGGTWERVNGDAETTTLESWKSAENDFLHGHAFSLKGRDTVYQERISIEKIGSSYYYIADVSHNVEPIKFEIVEIHPDHFIAVNPKHDFPKKIAYFFRQDTMVATISGDGRVIDYVFQKRK